MSVPFGASRSATPPLTVIPRSARLRSQAASTVVPVKSSTKPQPGALAPALAGGRAEVPSSVRSSRTAIETPTATTTTATPATSMRTRRRPAPARDGSAGAGGADGADATAGAGAGSGTGVGSGTGAGAGAGEVGVGSE